MNVEIILGFAIGFFLRSIALLAFLWIMIKIQKFEFAWLPLIGAAFLASALDTIPYAGHFIAVPVLYFCVWKITHSTLFPDAAFTVILSYALMRCLGWILLTINLSGFLATSALNHHEEKTNAPPIAVVVRTNQPEPKISKEVNKIAEKLSVKGITKGAGNPMLTFQYGAKSYVISLGDATSVSTEEGLVTVKFLEAGENFVTLGIHGEKIKYPLK